MTRRLARLADDVPIDLAWEDWRLRPTDDAACAKLFTEWGFQTLASQFRVTGTTTSLSRLPSTPPANRKAAPEPEPDLF